MAERGDTGFVELRGAEALAGPQHLEKHPSGALLVAVDEVHLRQNLEHGAAPGLDDTHVVPGVEPPVPERQHGAVLALLIRLIGQREVLEVRVLRIVET